MVSIRDVAKLAKVSTATVSRTLSDPEVVSESTRQRVMAAVEKTGYVVNPMARGLRTQKTGTVLVLVPDIGNPFFSQIIQGIESAAHADGYRILLGDTQGNRARERDYAKLAEQRQVDGIILLGASIPFGNTDASSWPPLVIGCEYFQDRSIPTVRIDNQAAAAEACAHLIELGHRRIGYLNGPPRSPLCIDRLAGYRAALRAAGIKYEAALVAGGDFTLEAGVAGMKQLLQLPKPPTAVFCASDEMALGAIRAAKEHGLKVPEDLSVVGFDDIQFAAYSDPPLTTIRQPRAEIGQRVMKLMVQLARGKVPAGADTVILPHALMRRGSTRAPRS